MNVAVFGTGVVGQAIAGKLISLGHTVTIGTRNVQKTLSNKEKDTRGNPPFGEWYKEHQNKVRLETYDHAATAAEVLFNCTAGTASVDALQQAGNGNLKGKTLIDIANPLDFSKGFPPSLSPGNIDSLGELIQRTFPELNVVKTLNTMVCYLMVNPALIPGDHNVFVSGNNESAKTTAKEILVSFGWKQTNIIDLGDITTARGTEQLVSMWIRLLGTFKNPMFNFNIVKANG